MDKRFWHLIARQIWRISQSQYFAIRMQNHSSLLNQALWLPATISQVPSHRDPCLGPANNPSNSRLTVCQFLKAALPEDISENYVKLPVDITLSWITRKPCDKIKIYTLFNYVVYTIEDYACLHCRVQFGGLDIHNLVLGKNWSNARFGKNAVLYETLHKNHLK